jgi:WD40 repeat protein
MPSPAATRRGCQAVLLVVLILIRLGGPVVAADDGPFLRIEAGVHEAAINAVAALPGGTDLVSVSDDKTARVWSLGTLAPNGIMRPPIGPEDVGALYAVAASEKVIAMAGRLLDPATGRFSVALYLRADLSSAGMLRGFPAPITALRFSRSGKLLAVGMQGAGIRVLDLSTGKTAFHDGTFDGTVSGLDFDADDRLAVAAGASGIRLYAPDGQATKLPPLARTAAPWRVAFSPNGDQLAIGDHVQPAVHLLDTRKLQYAPDLRGAPLNAGALSAVAYAPDGKTLFAAGRYIDNTGQILIRRFALGPHPTASDIKATRQSINDLLPLTDGLIFATADPALVRLDPTGAVTASVSTSHADFRAAGPDSLLVSQDGSVVQFPGSDGKTIRFDAVAHAIVDADGRPMHKFFAAAAGFSVTEWTNSHTPKLNGATLMLEPAETVRSVAVLPNGSAAAIGSDFYLRLAGRVGELWRVPTEAPVWAVNTGSDGRLVVAALGDGTIHWYDTASGHELLGLLLDPPTKRFVLWTPQGFFDHDHRTDGRPDGRGLIGYRFNTASGRDSDFAEIGQLYPIFFRPDLVGLSLRDDPAARRIVAAQSSLLGNVALALAGGLPARVTLLDACAPTSDGCGQSVNFDPTAQNRSMPPVTGERVRVRYRLDDTAGAPGPVVIKRNDAVIAADVTVLATEPRARVEQATISLATGVNRIRLSPVSANGKVEAADDATARFDVTRSPPPAAAVSGAPPGRTLYMLSAGVGDYQEPDLGFLFALPNASRDARAVAEAFAAPGPKVYDTVQRVVLTDKDATRAAITGALRDIAAKARPDDMVVIFLAGHGMSVAGHYYYAAGDIGLGGESLVDTIQAPPTQAEADAAMDALFERYGVSQDSLLPLLQSIAASHVALILDTCFSASVATSDAVARRDLNVTVSNRIGHATGRFVLSSAFLKAGDSGGADMAEHGLFTSYFLRAFQGEADMENSGMIDIYKLSKYLSRTVLAHSSEMARKAHNDNLVQEPSFYFSGNDFFDLRAVAQVKKAGP